MNKQCKNCKSYDVTSNRMKYKVCLAMTILSIPWFFILVGVIFFIVFLLLTLNYYKKRNTIECNNCKYSWNEEK